MAASLATLPTTDAAEQVCATLAELLGLDSAWLIETGGEQRVRGSWAREGSALQRLGEQRIRAAAATVADEVDQRREGRYAFVLAPVFRSARRAGVLVGVVRSGRRFTEDDLRCAALLAAVGAPVFAGVESLPGAGGRSGEHMQLLQSLAGALARARSEVDVAWSVVDELRTMIDYHACRFYLLSPLEDCIVPIAHAGFGSEYENDRSADLVCALGEGVAGRAMIDFRPRLVHNARVDEFAVEIEGTDPIDESMLVAPMATSGDPIGVIVLTKVGAGMFDEDDLRLLEVIASHAAVACENARLYADARDQAEVSEALLDLGEALAVQATVEDVCRMIAVAIDRLVECAALSVWLREDDQMRMVAQNGYTPIEARLLRGARLTAAGTLFGGALDSRRVAIRTLQEADHLASCLTSPPSGSSFAVVAVGERAANRAAIVIQRGPRRGVPSNRDQRMLVGIADQSLLAIANRDLYRELEESFLSTVQALANALETKDEYTGDHAQALIGLSSNVADRLGVDGQALRDISFAAALHDIGKIGIPAEILNKPSALTADEWEVMKLHPELGARIIEPVPALSGARELVIACHEHWDGSGYPFGLAGEEIPLGAQVILVCDAFHAMTSDRVYRRAMPLPDAIAELRRCAGTHFAPEAAAALIDAVTEPGEE